LVRDLLHFAGAAAGDLVWGRRVPVEPRLKVTTLNIDAGVALVAFLAALRSRSW
jgi:hypothetical protein